MEGREGRIPGRKPQRIGASDYRNITLGYEVSTSAVKDALDGMIQAVRAIQQRPVMILTDLSDDDGGPDPMDGLDTE